MNVTYRQTDRPTDVWTPQTHRPRCLKVKRQTFQQWPIQEIPKWGRQSAHPADKSHLHTKTGYFQSHSHY